MFVGLVILIFLRFLLPPISYICDRILLGLNRMIHDLLMRLFRNDKLCANLFYIDRIVLAQIY